VLDDVTDDMDQLHVQRIHSSGYQLYSYRGFKICGWEFTDQCHHVSFFFLAIRTLQRKLLGVGCVRKVISHFWKDLHPHPDQGRLPFLCH
jgi:hypothetical protein